MHNHLKKSVIAALIAFPLATGLSGCVTTADMDSLRLEVRQTRGQLNKRLDTLDKQVKTTDATLRKEIEKSSSPMQTQQANMYADVNALKMQIAKLQGTIDSMSESVDKINAGDSNSTISLPELAMQLETMRLAIESQLAVDLDIIQPSTDDAKKDSIGSTSSTVDQAGIAAVVAPEVKKPDPVDPAQALYDKALAQFKERKYKDAIRDWSEFSKTFPKHKLVPNAIFWEGECYYQLKDYANAALKYQGVIAKFSKSNKYRPALLKQGICLIKLGKTKSGKYILEDLIKKAPKSTEAKRAKSIIKDLK